MLWQSVQKLDRVPRLLESHGFFSLKFQDLESPGKISMKITRH